MSMEDAVIRLANAIVAQDGNIAVREIIRQRDEALKSLQNMTNDRDGWKRWHDEEQSKKWEYIRSNTALRGVITRMKKVR